MIFILSSPSGGGKSSLAKALLAHDSNLQLSISATTRAPRGQEQEGVAYFFKTKQQFEELIQHNKLLEYATVHGNLYGTPLEYVENCLRQNIDILFDIDTQGARNIKQHFPNHAVSIFILPPSIEILQQRLLSRQQDSVETIEQRLIAAKNELECAGEYDYQVVNDVFEQTVIQIQQIIAKARQQNQRIK